MSLGSLRALTLCLLAVVTSACGTDDSREEADFMLNVVKGTIQSRINPPTRVPRDLEVQRQTVEALRLSAPDDPLADLRFQSVGIGSVVRRIETNGDHTVWAAWGSSDRKSIITKNGMITATRGLRMDLMWADADAVLALVRNRQEGVAQYIQRYLDGNHETVEAKSTCTVSRGYDKSVNLSTGPAPVLQMFSSCISSDRQFVDLFLVDYSGRILEMRQWVGPILGFAYMRQLR